MSTNGFREDELVSRRVKVNGEYQGCCYPLSIPPDDVEKGPPFVFEKEELKKILADAVDCLSRKERLVVSLYYFEELTMKEIGAVLRVNESRVSQLHTKAMLRLRGKLKNSSYRPR